MQPEWLTSTVTALARSCAPPCSHSTSNFTREIVRLWLRSLSQRSCRATPAGLVAILVVIGDLTVGDLSGPGQEVTITLGMAKVNSTLSTRSEEHTSELQSHSDLVCRLLLEKKKIKVRAS